MKHCERCGNSDSPLTAFDYAAPPVLLVNYDMQPVPPGIQRHYLCAECVGEAVRKAFGDFWQHPDNQVYKVKGE